MIGNVEACKTVRAVARERIDLPAGDLDNLSVAQSETDLQLDLSKLSDERIQMHYSKVSNSC